MVPTPVDACHVSLYKEHFTKTKAGWIPDALEPVLRLPHFGAMPDPADKIPGQTTRVYLLDLWIPPDARPPGFRLELQLKVGDWVVWPMEVRVLPFSVPAQSGRGVTQAAAGGRAAGCRLGSAGAGGGPIRRRRRIAGDRRGFGAGGDPAERDSGHGAGGNRWIGTALRKVWEAPRAAGAEGYLRVRDWIYKQSLSTLHARR